MDFPNLLANIINVGFILVLWNKFSNMEKRIDRKMKNQFEKCEMIFKSYKNNGVI